MAKSFTDHPDFHRVSTIADAIFRDGLKRTGDGVGVLIPVDSIDDVKAGKIVDDMTRFFLKALGDARYRMCSSAEYRKTLPR